MSTKKKNNKTSAKKVDLLDQDKSISGQKYVCVSFLSPDKILKKKELYFFNEFIRYSDMHLSIKRFEGFLNFLSFKYNIEFTDIMENLEEYIKNEKDELKNPNIVDEYNTFIEQNEDKLTETFNKNNSFQTNVRGIKIRGSFGSQEEAEVRCQYLRKVDPNHDIFVGPVGVWMPWDPDAYKTGRVEFMEKELNELMSEKVKNQDKAKDEFEYRVKEMKHNAINDNIEKAKQNDIKLTQTIDEDGNLIKTKTLPNIDDLVVAETNRLNSIPEENDETKNEVNNVDVDNVDVDNSDDKVSVEDIKEELFDKE